MKHGLFINQKKAICSIYESGLMIKDVIKGYSNEYTIDYAELDASLTGISTFHYDFFIVNWHNHTLNISNSLLNKLIGPKIAIVVEVNPNDYIPYTPDWFDAYAVIDPTKERSGKFFPFPRPLVEAETKPLLDENKFILGSFGLYSEQFSNEKRFDEIIDAANSSNRDCVVRINLPLPTYTNTSITQIANYGKWLEKKANSNVDVVISHDYMDRNKLIAWLSEHNMNCFPYYRERPGLAAVTDQAVSSGRAIMTTNCSTFRHLHKYIDSYPNQSYLSLAESTLYGVGRMRNDWSANKFRLTFDNMLRELRII